MYLRGRERLWEKEKEDGKREKEREKEREPDPCAGPTSKCPKRTYSNLAKEHAS